VDQESNVKANIQVTGMVCDGCKGRVEKLLAKVPDLTTIEVELGRVTVDAKDDLAIQAALDALHKAKYGANVEL
jgi:copper chaperone CopZ